MSGAVEVEAPAKVNLRLRVLAREESGYHSLESLFCALDLTDVLRVEAGGEGVALRVEGDVDTGPTGENLVVRAARRFLAEAGREGEGVRLLLRKRIPAAAGLGGGSSDAAATLRAMNRLYDGIVDDGRLLQLAIELGSDVPFFLCGSPLALGWSRGERLLALPPLPPAAVLVANPGEPLSTRAAFAAIAHSRAGGYAPVAARLRLDQLAGWDEVAGIAVNDFEAPAAAAMPRVAEALEVLRGCGAAIALLAGSGPSVFGVFLDEEGVEAADVRLRGIGLATWQARTLSALPEVRNAPAGTA